MKIKIDTTHISDVLTGSSILEKHINDTWFYKDVELISGKIYALVSEYGQGCMYLSYLLGGNVKLGYVQVYVDGNSISEKDLKSLSWNLEPLCSKVKNQQVKKSIQQAIVKTGCKLTFEEISEQFFLTKERNDRKFKKLSGERWRASAALGFVNGKTIFYAPYMTSAFYYQMNSINLFKVLRYLADNGAVVVLPVGSDRFIRNIADECIYLDPEYLK